MSSLGQDLKQARERAAMTVAEIARLTKITPRLLQNLEDERFDQMPEPFFIKGVLKAYVRAVDGDEAHFLALYREIFPAAEPAAREAPPLAPARDRGVRTAAPPSHIHRPELQDFRAAKDRTGKNRRRGVRFQPWALAVLIVLLLAAAACLFLLYLQSRPKPAPSLPSAAPVVQPLVKPQAPADQPGTTQPAASSVSSSSAPPSSASPFSTAAGLKLSLRFTADTWIQVAADGRIVLNGNQAAGREQSFSADGEFVIQIGNAGGVDYTLNGRPGIPFGPTGAVRTDVRINRANAADFLRRTPAPEPVA
jgi:cytoskeleton protein RodZ